VGKQGNPRHDRLLSPVFFFGRSQPQRQRRGLQHLQLDAAVRALHDLALLHVLQPQSGTAFRALTHRTILPRSLSPRSTPWGAPAGDTSAPTLSDPAPPAPGAPDALLGTTKTAVTVAAHRRWRFTGLCA